MRSSRSLSCLRMMGKYLPVRQSTCDVNPTKLHALTVLTNTNGLCRIDWQCSVLRNRKLRGIDVRLIDVRTWVWTLSNGFRRWAALKTIFQRYKLFNKSRKTIYGNLAERMFVSNDIIQSPFLVPCEVLQSRQPANHSSIELPYTET